MSCKSSRPAWGAWIEIMILVLDAMGQPGRAPHGARGLKFHLEIINGLLETSRPAWGAWIEISAILHFDMFAKSRPAWGAWIEIRPKWASVAACKVAPRMGRVD